MCTQVAIAVVEQAGKFLIGRRPQGKPLAGLWEFPGGRVELYETPEQAAIRECQEETGLVVSVSGLLGRHDYRYAHDRVRLHFFLCRVLDSDVPPHDPFRWVAREQLARYSFPEANQEILFLLSRQP